MIRRAALLLVVACSSAPAHRPVLPPKPAAPPAVAEPALPDAPVPVVHKLRDAPAAPHGGFIAQIATSPDGIAALTADDMGSIRLWPTLDGKEEPRVVDLPTPKQLALGRRAEGGYTLVALDEVGGLYIAKLDAQARTASHTTLAAEPAVLGIVMTELGLLAWRADQTVVLLDGDGATKARIATQPRERVVEIGVAGKKAIAILETDDGSHTVRWLDLEPKLAWGSEIDLGADPGQDIALAPDHTHYAVARQGDRNTLIQVVDIAKKRVVASTTVMMQGVELAFVDNTTLAVGTFEGVSWIDMTLPVPVMSQVLRTSGSRVAPILAAAGGKAVTTQNGELVLATPATTEFLGYDIVAPRFVERAGNGELLVGMTDTFTFLDGNLRERSSSAIALPANNSIIQLLWLGGDDWLVETAGGGHIGLSVFAIAQATGTVLRSTLKESNVLMYEPATQLVTLSLGVEAEVAKWNPRTRQLTKLASISKPSAYEQELFAPVDPKLAAGNQLVVVAMRDRPTIKWLRDAASLTTGVSASLTIDGSYAGADAAGHVFVWRNTPGNKLELAVYAAGKQLAKLPAPGPVSLWPDRDGKRVIEVGANAIGLYQISDGKSLWTQELASVQEAIWLTDGTLAITSAGGIAHLDPATGDVTVARCGWRFGLTKTPHPQPSRTEPLCAQRSMR